MQPIYARDLDAFKGPKRRAREQRFREFIARITLWSVLAVLGLPHLLSKAHA